MLYNKKIVVILPAYNASKTLEQTYGEIPLDIVDDVVLTDDFSNDNTIEVAKRIGIKHIIEQLLLSGKACCLSKLLCFIFGLIKYLLFYEVYHMKLICYSI